MSAFKHGWVTNLDGSRTPLTADEADASRFRGGTDPHHYRMDLATTARKYAAAIRSRGVAG